MTPLVMWRVYKHPKDYPGEYVARKFVITEDFYGPNNESISSRSLRDVRNVLRSLYSGLIQLKRLPDDATGYRGGMVMSVVRGVLCRDLSRAAAQQLRVTE